jgi:hypothetical protein
MPQRWISISVLIAVGLLYCPAPKMDDPCNANPLQQSYLIPNPLSATCPPRLCLPQTQDG